MYHILTQLCSCVQSKAAQSLKTTTFGREGNREYWKLERKIACQTQNTNYKFQDSENCNLKMLTLRFEDSETLQVLRF